MCVLKVEAEREYVSLKVEAERECECASLKVEAERERALLHECENGKRPRFSLRSETARVLNRIIMKIMCVPQYVTCHQ